MTYEQRKAQDSLYLGKVIDIEIDRPVGYVHVKKTRTLTYPINYGYIPGVIGGDGEELDVYLLGVDRPVKKYKGCRVLAVIHREDDDEDKLVAAPAGQSYTAEQILQAVSFQEQYHKHHIEVAKTDDEK